MSLAEQLGFGLGYRAALVAGIALAMVATFLVMRPAMRKLRAAGITGRDRNKPDAPELPEMGGLAVFVAFNIGVFAVLMLGGLSAQDQTLVLASLIVAAGACITGVIDDLVALRQRFKAFIPLAFAAPLALYAPDTSLAIPLVGHVNLGVAYAFVLVPLAIASASNGFNMLEGFNGLGAGLGIIIGAALIVLALLSGNLLGLTLLFPLLGALGAFLWFNFYPARVFPGDTLTLLVGAVLAASAVLSKVEVYGALLFLPHIVEFFLKARGHFEVQSFATGVTEDGALRYDGPVRSLTHVVMTRGGRVTEPGLTAILWGAEFVLACVVVGAFVLTHR